MRSDGRPLAGAARAARGVIGGMALSLIALIAPALGAGSAMAAGDANQSSCSVSSESSAGFRAYLPDCRAYEMVTPPYMEGSHLASWALATDGSSLMAGTFGNFAGTNRLGPYDFSRGASSWSVSYAGLPQPSFIEAATGSALGVDVVAHAANLSSVLASGTPRALEREYFESVRAGDEGEGTTAIYRLGLQDGVAGEPVEVGPGAPSLLSKQRLEYVGASSDLSHVVLGMAIGNGALAKLILGVASFWPGDHQVLLSDGQSLYEYEGTGNSEPTLVGVANEGRLEGSPHVNEGAEQISQCGTALGGGSSAAGLGGAEQPDKYNAISSDGATVLFTAFAGETREATRSRCNSGSFSEQVPYEGSFECKPEKDECPASERSRIEGKLAERLKELVAEGSLTEPSTVEYCGESLSSGCNVRVTPPEAFGPVVNEIYARIDGSHTVAVSEPSHADCSACDTDPAQRQNAIYQGASQNGEKVFFLTEQELLQGQTGMNLYEYDFNGPAGQKISLVSAGSGSPEVQGVMAVSADGSRVYFAAKAVLTAEPDSSLASGHDAAEVGADNLYVYDASTHELHFVATLSSEDEADWQIEDRDRPVQASTCPPATGGCEVGRYVVFVSRADLTEGDTSTGAQLFRYDAREGRVVRVSVGEDGVNEDGNIASPSLAPTIPTHEYGAQVEPAEENLTAVSSGGTVFFESPVGLTRSALNRVALAKVCRLTVSGYANFCLEFYIKNGYATEEQLEQSGALVTVYAQNVYEYRAGHVYLISDGHDHSWSEFGPNSRLGSNVHLVGADLSGQDVFFETADSLVPEDTNTGVDLYDARVGGGFPASASASSCTGGVCRGATAVAPPVGGALSAGQRPGGNLARLQGGHGGKQHSAARRRRLRHALHVCNRRFRHNGHKRQMCKRGARRRYGGKARSGRRRHYRKHERRHHAKDGRAATGGK